MIQLAFCIFLQFLYEILIIICCNTCPRRNYICHDDSSEIINKDHPLLDCWLSSFTFFDCGEDEFLCTFDCGLKSNPCFVNICFGNAWPSTSNLCSVMFRHFCFYSTCSQAVRNSTSIVFSFYQSSKYKKLCCWNPGSLRYFYWGHLFLFQPSWSLWISIVFLLWKISILIYNLFELRRSIQDICRLHFYFCEFKLLYTWNNSSHVESISLQLQLESIWFYQMLYSFANFYILH